MLYIHCLLMLFQMQMWNLWLDFNLVQICYITPAKSLEYFGSLRIALLSKGSWILFLLTKLLYNLNFWTCQNTHVCMKMEIVDAAQSLVHRSKSEVLSCSFLPFGIRNSLIQYTSQVDFAGKLQSFCFVSKVGNGDERYYKCGMRWWKRLGR